MYLVFLPCSIFFSFTVVGEVGCISRFSKTFATLRCVRFCSSPETLFSPAFKNPQFYPGGIETQTPFYKGLTYLMG